MWTDVKSKEARDALVQEHLARSACLKKRFAAEKLGEADFQVEAAKLFHPITGEAEKQAAAQSKEIQKLASALEHLPRQIAEEANYNPIAALFGGEAPQKVPRPALEPYPLAAGAREEESSPMVVNQDRDLDLETLKRYNFKPPSALDLTNTDAIEKVIEGINRVNTHRLGAAKRKAHTEAEKAAIDKDQDALREYRARLRTLTEGYKLVEKKGSGLQAGPLKLRGDRFGNLTLDLVALQVGKVRAFDGGNLVLEAPADAALYDLLTKRFGKTKQYTPAAISTFKKLVELAGLAVHGRQSRKYQLIRGGCMYYCDPNQLVERLNLLVASKKAGNTGVDNEIAAILDALTRTGQIEGDLALQLNKTLLA
jgi:hypothetical protein